MDTDGTDGNGCEAKPLGTVENTNHTGVVAVKHANGDDDSESNSLLPPPRGGMSRKSDKVRRKVQWNDRNGNKLVEVLEFEPSDVSDSDDDDSDSCMCTIM
ncbi:uncharacterized protein LOC112492237 [Ziziphus jujuba]|uniref:Uncharacterized protein LOC112492237 n=1 Tax=Ziziphus jujuba TaxID=326968 RepID=A0ABM3IR54_ZIZJJ|nr:uncharacterized protein LOC112492237 [Ziziphus jujuba]